MSMPNSKLYKDRTETCYTNIVSQNNKLETTSDLLEFDNITHYGFSKSNMLNDLNESNIVLTEEETMPSLGFAKGYDIINATTLKGYTKME